MIEPEYLGLIHKSIDESLSADEHEKLQHYMEKNPQAQQAHDDFLNVAKGLSALAQLEPSSNLKKNIMNRIPARKYAPREKYGFLRGLFDSRNLRPNLKLGYAFSAGLIAGFLLMVLFAKIFLDPTAPNIEDLQGAMALKEKMEPLEGEKGFKINLQRITGNVQLQYSKTNVWLELRLQSPQEIEVSLDFPSPGIRFRGFFPRDQTRTAFFVDGQEIKLIHNGENNYTLLFDRNNQMETALNFSFSDVGAILLKKQLLIPAE